LEKEEDGGNNQELWWWWEHWSSSQKAELVSERQIDSLIHLSRLQIQWEEGFIISPRSHPTSCEKKTGDCRTWLVVAGPPQGRGREQETKEAQGDTRREEGGTCKSTAAAGLVQHFTSAVLFAGMTKDNTAQTAGRRYCGGLGGCRRTYTSSPLSSFPLRPTKVWECV
jgi:hypothetical protein